MRLNRNGFAAAQVVNFPFPKLQSCNLVLVPFKPMMTILC